MHCVWVGMPRGWPTNAPGPCRSRHPPCPLSPALLCVGPSADGYLIVRPGVARHPSQSRSVGNASQGATLRPHSVACTCICACVRRVPSSLLLQALQLLCDLPLLLCFLDVVSAQGLGSPRSEQLLLLLSLLYVCVLHKEGALVCPRATCI